MRLPLALLLAAMTAANGADPASSARDLAKETKIASGVSGSSAVAAVRSLVSFGPRTGGTPSGDRAAAWVERALRDIGLKVEVVEDPPMSTHEETAWMVALGDKPLRSAWPWNFSPSLRETIAPLVLERDDGPEAASDLKGAAVLTSAMPFGDRCARLAAMGAVALLTDAPGDPNRYVEWTPIFPMPERCRGAGGVPIFGLSYRDGRGLRDALERATAGSGPAPKVTIRLASRVAQGRPRTVVGTLPGAGERKEEILIVCAHGDSDSGGPGADDNASGVASLIEVARALSAAAGGGLLSASRPEVRFIVWGAEYHSSRAYATARAAELPRIRAVINYDETGTGAERDAVYYEGNDIPWNEPLLRTLESVAEDHAGQPGFPTLWTSNPAMGGTDAYVFLPSDYQGQGVTDAKIPSTTVFSAAWGTPSRMKQTPGWKSKGWPEGEDLFVDYSAYYHSSGDTPTNTTDAEPWNMERCAKLVAVALSRLMEAAPRSDR